MKALTLAVLLAAVARAETFDIPSGDATYTLYVFSCQADLQMLFDFKVAHGQLTQGVHGEMPPAQAIDRMLASTTLRSDLVNERTLAIVSVREAICMPWLGAAAPLPPCHQFRRHRP